MASRSATEASCPPQTDSLKLACPFLADMVDAPVPLAFNTMSQNSEEVLKKDDQKKETVRTFFPETWIWDLVSVG